MVDAGISSWPMCWKFSSHSINLHLTFLVKCDDYEKCHKQAMLVR